MEKIKDPFSERTQFQRLKDEFNRSIYHDVIKPQLLEIATEVLNGDGFKIQRKEFLQSLFESMKTSAITTGNEFYSEILGEVQEALFGKAPKNEPIINDYLRDKQKKKRLFDPITERRLADTFKTFPDFGETNMRNLFSTIIDSREKGIDDRSIFRYLVRKYHPDRVDMEDPKYKTFENVIRILGNIYDPKKKVFLL